MPQKTALITGITGQDGSYLADFLLHKKYRVAGIGTPGLRDHLWRLEYFGISDKIELHRGDLCDHKFVERVVRAAQPDEVYNLASMSSVAQSWDDPTGVFKINALAAITLLDILRRELPRSRFFQASSAEMYGDTARIVTEKTNCFNPRNPYGVAKLAAHLMLQKVRRQHGLYAVSGILYNHESPLRPDRFMTQAAAASAADVAAGQREYAEFGNLNVRRDFGFAGDFVRAMWLTLQQRRPEDYVICTGQVHSARDFVREAFLVAGVRSWQRRIRIAQHLQRSEDASVQRGSNAKLRALGWRPEVTFKKLVKMMVDHQLRRYDHPTS